MINIISQNGDTGYSVLELVFDTVSDLSNLPTDCAAGSTAFCIATKTLYMLSGSKEWKEI